MKSDQFQDITYKKGEDGVVMLTFNTPKRKNALSLYSFYEIYSAVDIFENDDSAHAMILTGAVDPEVDEPAKEAYSSGGYFSSDAYDNVSEKVMQQLDLSDIAQKRTTMKMFQCDKPILAAVNGLAIGGAFTLTLAGADQIFMSEHAWIQLPFAKLGVSAELGSSYLLPQLLGFQKTKEILFYAERITAAKALELGLANKVVPHSELLAYVHNKALKLIPPLGASQAIREMKKLINQPHVEAMNNALDRENLVLQNLFQSSDFKEAITARGERRPAVFKGA